MQCLLVTVSVFHLVDRKKQSCEVLLPPMDALTPLDTSLKCSIAAKQVSTRVGLEGNKTLRITSLPSTLPSLGQTQG